MSSREKCTNNQLIWSRSTVTVRPNWVQPSGGRKDQSPGWDQREAGEGVAANGGKRQKYVGRKSSGEDQVEFVSAEEEDCSDWPNSRRNPTWRATSGGMHIVSTGTIPVGMMVFFCLELIMSPANRNEVRYLSNPLIGQHLSYWQLGSPQTKVRWNISVTSQGLDRLGGDDCSCYSVSVVILFHLLVSLMHQVYIKIFCIRHQLLPEFSFHQLPKNFHNSYESQDGKGSHISV